MSASFADLGHADLHSVRRGNSLGDPRGGASIPTSRSYFDVICWNIGQRVRGDRQRPRLLFGDPADDTESACARRACGSWGWVSLGPGFCWQGLLNAAGTMSRGRPEAKGRPARQQAGLLQRAEGDYQR
jgi:hypothetical protein